VSDPRPRRPRPDHKDIAAELGVSINTVANLAAKAHRKLGAPAPYNSRKALKAGDVEYQELRRSIQEFGLVDPVIWNSRTRRVVGRHQRLTVRRDLGHTTVPAVVVDLDEAREKALNLALNRIAGEWDEAMLAEVLRDLERDVDITLTGFDPSEIDKLLREYADFVSRFAHPNADRLAHVTDERMTAAGVIRTNNARATRAADKLRLIGNGAVGSLVPLCS